MALTDTLIEECGSENWDGENALPIAERSLHVCQWFLHQLNEAIQLPELWCEPIGRVNATWEIGSAEANIAFCDDRELLIVGVDTHGRNYIKCTFDKQVAELVLQQILGNVYTARKL